MARSISLPWRLAVTLLPVAALIVFYPLKPPTLPTSGFQGFSTDRAREHLRAITAGGPHPVESVQNDRVRDYLIDQFRKSGLSTEVQTATVFQRRARNILARLPGTAPQPGAAVMLVAHYDSVTTGPGAADDGAAVAALLETAHLLSQSARPRQDVLFLITDGEEAGLLGARAFCGDLITAYKEDVRARNPGAGHDGLPPHPALADVGIVLNFDARGSAGPAIMFETSPGNRGLIQHFAAAAPYPVANSFSYDVYRLLRNDSDFTIFRRAGKAGLNVAFIGDYFNYHTANDTPQNLDPRSLYHDGTYALSLARHFANLDATEITRITTPDQPNAVYFTPTPRLLLHYPTAWIWPLTALQLLTAATVLTLALRRRVVSGGGLLRAFARWLLALLLAVGAVYALGYLRPPQSSLALALQLTAIVTTVVIITLAAALASRRPTNSADLTAVALLLLSLLSIPLNIWLPGGSFLTLWPAFCLVASLAAMITWPPHDWRRLATHAASSLPILFVMVPLALTLLVALTLNAAAFLAPVLVLVTWTLLGTIAPALAHRATTPQPT